MPDLTTRLGQLTLRNPLIAASSELTMTEAGICACIDAGAGAVVAKSINETAEAAAQLAIADYAFVGSDHRARSWETADRTMSLFNRSGLAGGTTEAWITMLGRTQKYAEAQGSFVIGSITVAEPQPAAEIAAAMSQVVPAIELNIGAPHGREARAVRQVTETRGVIRYVEAVRGATAAPLIVKLPGQGSDIVEMARAAVDAGADMVGLAGRLNGFLPNLDTWEPELGSWGAIGGPWSLPLSLYWVSKTFRVLDVPLVGTGGARTGTDLARFLLSGATAIEVASVLLIDGPAVIRDLLADLNDYLTDHGVSQIAELIGQSARRAASYAELTPPTGTPAWSSLVDRALHPGAQMSRDLREGQE